MVASRKLLDVGWEVCAIAPQPAVDQPNFPAEDAGWKPAPELGPAASVLRARGEWSLDGPVRDFDAEDWWYRLRFDARRNDASQRLVLAFDGLATLSNVWLNGEWLLRSDTMFVAHECDVTELLRDQGNALVLGFRALQPQLSLRRARPRWRAPMVAHQQLRWLRTTLLGRTPGWSPPAAVVGPWRPVWLERRGESLPRKVLIEPLLAGALGIVRCEVEFAPNARLPASLMLRLARDEQEHAQMLERLPGRPVYRGQLNAGTVALWWPHTHGEPALYDAHVEIPGSGDKVALSLYTARIGFRTIDVDTRNGGFTIRINGVPVFCRGACWTPLDPVSLRSNPEAAHGAVAQAAEAGMNMLRLPGTTVYEEDHFYDSCDALGVLVWQDFMFANMDYPADDEAFSASALKEVRQQLERLRQHACLAVFCGNSEVSQQAAMWGAPRELWSPSFFDGALRDLCRELAPRIAYWPSSAHGGAIPFQPDTGTTSYYGVGAYLRPIEDARLSAPVFATECLAFANIPAPSALARMPGGHATRTHHPNWKERSPRDLGAGWDFDDVRDHYIEQLFRLDANGLRAVDHERYLALGRMATAEVMSMAFAQWRRSASGCNGALVLCLRDFWAGAGWGVIDDAGVPKACYHALKRALQPVTLLITDEGMNGLYVHLINETGEARRVTLTLSAWKDGDVKVAHAHRSLALPARTQRTLPCLELLDHFVDLNWAYRFGPPPCDAVCATLQDDSGQVVAQAFHFVEGLCARPTIDVGLHVQAVLLGNAAGELKIRTTRFAQGIHLDVPGFAPVNDHFHLPPECETRVRLRRTGPGPQALAGWVHALNSTQGARFECATLAGSR